MYVVLRGEKTFTLLPPTDVAFLPQKDFPTLRHSIKSTIHPCEQRIKQSDLDYTTSESDPDKLTWIDVDIDDPNNETQYQELFDNIQPIRCVVRAGETLYIPAMWYHQVSQSCLTISINFWYEMRFDFRCGNFEPKSKCPKNCNINWGNV